MEIEGLTCRDRSTCRIPALSKMGVSDCPWALLTGSLTGEALHHSNHITVSLYYMFSLTLRWCASIGVGSLLPAGIYTAHVQAL